MPTTLLLATRIWKPNGISENARMSKYHSEKCPITFGNLKMVKLHLHWIVMITKKFEVLDFADLCWLSLAFLAFLKLKLAFVDGN